jgi:hypothetical protein
MVAIYLAHPYFGYPRMQTALWAHERVVDPIGDSKETESLQLYPSVVYPNRLKRQFHAISPQLKLVTDITYISDGTHFYSLSAIQDLFNNEMVAWQISKRIQWSNGHEKETPRKPCTIRTKASNIRLRRTTHD